MKDMTINYDERKVPPYTLPEALAGADGRTIVDAKDWPRRRAEILEVFQREVYGRALGAPPALRFEVVEQDDAALDGLAVRKQVLVHFTDRADGPSMELLIYLPRHATGPVPLFVGLNFFGNHTIHPDPKIRLSTRWMRASERAGVVDHRATEASRGFRRSRWPVERILQRGYGLATIYYGDLAADDPERYRQDVLSLFQDPSRPRQPDDAGAIGAWAWGLSRALDYFQTDPAIDAARVAAIGHSRLGKTALWAGATDPRFAMVISNNAGCGGPALSRRFYGETVQLINDRFPHWFCENFRKYESGPGFALPIDQHMLIAAIAPRPVYVASAVEDRWADPRGEYLGALHADPVYRLLGTAGLPVREMPKVNEPVVHGTIGYHLRSGGHDLTEYDWQQYLDFADRNLRAN